MGAFSSRQNAVEEEVDIVSTQQYRFPPKNGAYFGTHFIMGGERFDTPQPESYLFGENGDLNFLGCKPTPFPYPPPQTNEPTKTLNSLVNIRKESIRFVKASDPGLKSVGTVSNKSGSNPGYNIEFIFDSDVKCAITIYYFCMEEVTPSGIVFTPRDSALTSETFHFQKGINQLFSQPSHIFSPHLFSDDDLAYSESEIPIAIHCLVDEAYEDSRQSHTTICVVDHHTDGTYAMRALKQKIFVDGLYYLLQEIYGIENKNLNKAASDEDAEDTGSECVICMCDIRDTLILPCRHLCLCNSCADSLRYQANNCPICRAPFKALLQVRAVQKSPSANPHPPANNNCDNIPNGYVLVSLIEALNGPATSMPITVQSNNTIRLQNIPDSGDGNETSTPIDPVQAAEILNGSQDKSVISQNGKDSDKMKDKDMRLSVIMLNDDDRNNQNVSKTTSSILNRVSSLGRGDKPKLNPAAVQKSISRDNLKIINEKNLSVNSPNYLNAEDEDSDTEKLSPLLNNKALSPKMKDDTALKIDGVDDPIDENSDTDHDDLVKPLDHSHANLTNGEKKDLKKSKENISQLSTPVSTLKESTTSSLPDSPISGNSTSTRSSGDSYSSSSSTRQLLGSSGNTDPNSHQYLDNSKTGEKEAIGLVAANAN